jgi:glutamine cyclotransferase
MTKKQWQNITVGTKVWMKHNGLEWVDGKCLPKTVYLTGVIKRINSNRSQALVDWGDNEIWHGRLSLELMDSFPNDIQLNQN